MKKTNTLLNVAFLAIILSGCGARNNEKSELQYANDSIAILNKQLDSLQSKIKLLSYPADQRFQSARSLFEESKYSEAREEIKKLRQIFPKSQEAIQGKDLLIKIAEAEKAQKAEQDRIKALGFKALTPNLSAKIGVNSISFSNITTSKKYTFDSCPEARKIEEKLADRGSKFVLTTMKVTSTSKNPLLPIPAVYRIEGSMMHFVGAFQINFALWNSYSHYLYAYEKGVENDFAKTSTISFKLGCLVKDDILAGPYAVVLKKSNVLSRRYNKYALPEVYYDGNESYPSDLSVDSFNDQFQLLKLTNL